jgi:hypothetical protein
MFSPCWARVMVGLSGNWRPPHVHAPRIYPKYTLGSYLIGIMPLLLPILYLTQSLAGASVGLCEASLRPTHVLQRGEMYVRRAWKPFSVSLMQVHVMKDLIVAIIQKMLSLKFED